MRTDWPERERFVAYLDSQRKRSGYRTWLALAEAADVSHTTLSNWRSGKQRPNLDNLQKVAEALGVSAGALAEHAGVDLTRFGISPPTPAAESYRDPATGEVYQDETERRIWDLDGITVAMRRSYIYQLRADRAAGETPEQQRRAG